MNDKYELSMIISGGQTGADRAGLDFAIEAGIPCAGWCPKGRKAEDGEIPLKYPLKETTIPDYPPRTRMNVRDSDATVLFTAASFSKGVLLTVNCCRKQFKPLFIMPFSNTPDPHAAAAFLHWLQRIKPNILNVAGSRASVEPQIYKFTYKMLSKAIKSRTTLFKPDWPPKINETPSLFINLFPRIQ